MTAPARTRAWKAWGLFDKTGDLIVVKVGEKPYKCCGDDTIGRVVVTREIRELPRRGKGVRP